MISLKAIFQRGRMSNGTLDEDITIRRLLAINEVSPSIKQVTEECMRLCGSVVNKGLHL